MERRIPGLAIIALSAIATFAPVAHSRPPDPGRLRGSIKVLDVMDLIPSHPASGAPAAPGDTVFFGGTVWSADSMRWEAIPDSVWTFDTGVGSHFDHSDPEVSQGKHPSLHARMEGWVGIDHTTSQDQAFRRLGTSDFVSVACVGAVAGLEGNYSFWAGWTEAQAQALGYADGQGYGNSWDIALQKTYVYPGAGLTVTVEFDHATDLEPGFDFVEARVDTGGPSAVSVWILDGLQSGHETLTLVPGVSMRSTPGPFTLSFVVTSDGSYSDEDGLYPTTCGAFAVDGIELSGAVTDGPATFETGADGWASVVLSAANDWSDVRALADLPPEDEGCDCGLQDSVLAFADLSLEHPADQDNVALSPWIDLKAGGVMADAGRFVEMSLFGELPPLGPILLQVQAQYYPYTDPGNGLVRVSDLTGNLFLGPDTDGRARCIGGGTPLRMRINVSQLIPPGAEQVRIAVGVRQMCFGWSCPEVSTSSPWFDNIRLGVYPTGQPVAFAVDDFDRPQDTFPIDGTLNLDSPGRVDPSLVPYGMSFPGDSLCVDAAGTDLTMEVVFAVRPGPGTDPVRLGSWLARHPSAGSWLGLNWHSARMDTAEAGNAVVAGSWMTAYHENDPNFLGSDDLLDPADPAGNGAIFRLKNDIFPDDLLTAGARLFLYYRAREGIGAWSVHPDTADGHTLEMEVLPSSLTSSGDKNCVLLLDASGDDAVQVDLEAGLAAVIPGGSSNVEGTGWDRWDLDGNAPLGRGLWGQGGASWEQLASYRIIILATGTRTSFRLRSVDVDLLTDWLTVDSGGGKGFFLTGDQAPYSVRQSPLGEFFLRQYFRTAVSCTGVQLPFCNASGMEERAPCLDLPQAGGAQFTSGQAMVVEGNGCATLREFNSLIFSGFGLGVGAGNLAYSGPTMGVTNFASVSNDRATGHTYRTVVDGMSVHSLRDPGCLGTGAVAARFGDVLDWFGEQPGEGCLTPTSTVGEREPGPVTARLEILSAQPVRSNGQVELLATGPDGMTADLSIFDIAGRRIRRLSAKPGPAGDGHTRWDLRNDSGRRVAPGLYFVRLSTPAPLVKRLVVLP